MILVDTSVWIDFFRGGSSTHILAELLADNRVLAHPWVVGELSLGSLRADRKQILEDLDRLPSAPRVPDPEVRELVESRRLWGEGIGWIDAHLVASALAVGGALWTLDRSLDHVARRLGVAPPSG